MGARRRAAAPPAGRGWQARPRTGLTRVSVASEGGAGVRKLSLRFVRNRCRELPAAVARLRGCGRAGSAAGQGRLRWITSCVEERGLGEGTEVCDMAWGQLAQRLLMQYQCNEPFGCRNYNSPSSQQKPTNKRNGKECSGCQAWCRAAKANLHAFPPTLVGKQHAD